MNVADLEADGDLPEGVDACRDRGDGELEQLDVLQTQGLDHRHVARVHGAGARRSYNKTGRERAE